MDEGDWIRRFEELERRLERLEKRAAGVEAAVTPNSSSRPPIAVAASAVVQPAQRITPPPLPVRPVSPSPSGPTRSRQELERAIGLKWTGWIGAIVLVAGVAFGVKFAYDQGWLGRMVPPVVWLGLIFVAAAGLIVCGEVIYRRVNTISAASVFGAGVAVLFLASYSGYFHFKLYPQSTAFILMGLTALVGALIAMRGNLVSIAVLALLGANLAPILLSTHNPRLLSFLIYLLSLQVVALFLADWGRGNKWWTLRGLSLATTAVWMGLILDAVAYNRASFVDLKLGFTLLFAGLYHMEVIVNALRRGKNSSQAKAGVPGAILTLITTSLAAAAVLYMLRDTPPAHRAIWLIGGAAICSVLGIICVRRAVESLRYLASSYALQSAGLLLAAVAAAFNESGTVIGWGILSLAFASLGRLCHMRIARFAAVVTWGLAVLFLAGNLSSDLNRIQFYLFSDPIHRSLLLAWLLAFAANGIASLGVWTATSASPVVDDWREKAMALHIAAATVWCVASILGLRSQWATIAMLIYAWRLYLPDVAAYQDRLKVLGAAMVVLVAVFEVAFSARAAPVWPYRPIFNLQLGIGVLIILSLFAIRPIQRDVEKRLPAQSRLAGLAWFSGALLPLMILWAGSFEIIQYCGSSFGRARFADPELAEQVGLSLFWACLAVACILVGFARRIAPLRYFALGLFAVTLLKVVLVDMSSVQSGYRVLSFLVMGGLLLGTSVLYGRGKSLSSDAQVIAGRKKEGDSV